jgi:D-alanyl-D-alanine carboxypeptidase
MHAKAGRKLKPFARSTAILASALGLAAAGLLPAPSAIAKTQHHRQPAPHYAQPAAQPFTGFGPTAPGVSAILIDARSGAVLSESGADIPRYPASLTKLMVLDLAFQAIRDGRMTLDTQIPVSGHAAAVEPVKLGLQPGDSLTVRQAVLAMTTMSANDAATALGEYLGGGSEIRCGQMMTLRAHVIGMAQTEFYNASGLPNPNQVSTARDLAILARDIVVNFPQDQPFFEVQQFNLNGHTIYSNNQMLKLYPGATGMKTGYTILARHNLITSAVRGGRVLIGVVLHEPSWGQTYAQMTAMMDNGFGTPFAPAPGSAPAGGTLVAANQPPAASAANRSTAASAANQPPAASAANRSTAASAANQPPTQRPGLSLFPSANAATVRPPAPSLTGWTAQLGSFSKIGKARSKALAVRQMRGVGVPRVAKVERNGRVLWTAQLAGLTEPAAHATCSALAARGDSCIIIAPPNEHLAARDNHEG